MKKTFLKGLLAILPLGLSIYILIWLFKMFDGLALDVISWLIKFIPGLKAAQEIPGLGIIGGIVCIYLLGFLLSSKLFNWFFDLIQFPLRKFPFIKSIYSAIGDLMFFFGDAQGKGSGLVPVKVHLDSLGFKVIGLLTREDASELSFSEETVGVFVPMSYMWGGLTIFVERSKIEKLEISVEFTMKSAIIAWMKAKNRHVTQEAIASLSKQNPS